MWGAAAWSTKSWRKLLRHTGHDSKVLHVSRALLANGRGRWLALAASIAVSAAIFHAQATRHPCCAEIPAATPTAKPSGPTSTAHVQGTVPASAPRLASRAEVESLAASAPTTAQQFQFALPPGVAPEEGLQVHTIRAARAISVLFPEITTIGGFRQDPLKWHPSGLAIDVMIPNYHSPEGIELGNQIAGLALANAKRWGGGACDLAAGLLPGYWRAQLDRGLRLRNRKPLRPRSYRHRRRWVPERARNLLHLMCPASVAGTQPTQSSHYPSTD
ncbi:hypothetical protein MYXE_06730 [Mycobacterium xenopi]|uniref:ARB-07466-like C-terminal domain-containing protein n=1 Tax=Mycobacterium xenopi TaxID=1789 RepID=A0AAD1GWZ8_MYCXE|nr:hypothetical protein MYXE_06730 [Mycobacterium xenopi]